MFHLTVIATTLACPDAHALVDKMMEFRVEEETRTEMIQIVKDQTAECWDANADWRNGVLSTLSEDKPMAQVTYRGVKYDSEAYRQMVQAEAQKRNHELMYRGIKVERKFATQS